MEPHHHHYNGIRQHPPPPQDPRHHPPPGQWYPPPAQYQYQPPPPPHHQQWAPHHQLYPPPPYPHRPHLPPPPPHQDWGNANWSHHPGWEYPARQDEEDWAAKARAWAANNTVTDTQHPQSQFTPVSRIEGQSPYQDPYQQPLESHYADVHSSNPSPVYHHYPANNSGPSSYVPDEHVAYGANDGRFSLDTNHVYHHQESSSVSSLVHMQEVPSSYSSIAGNVEIGDGREKPYKSYPYSTDSTQIPFHDHMPPPTVDISNQPLSFTPRSSFDHEQMMQQNYNNNNDSGRHVRGVDSVAAAPPSHYSLTSSNMSGVVYPPLPQHGPSASLNSSFPGHSTPSFGMMSGSTFQPSIPPIGIGASNVFPGDIYGVLSSSDRPKKPPVPDWLKEEIIKNKAILASSGPERPSDSIEDETFDKTPGRADQEDSQSIGSPRSAVEEDEEDNMEAVRTAEVNQEIKRILTEVLLKVTDELFDEIATQVLEEDLTTQVSDETVTLDQKPSFPFSAVPTSKASAKVLIAAKSKVNETEDENGKSLSSSPGDLLGLASYASDNDDDDADNSVQHQPSIKNLSEDDNTAENATTQAKFEEDKGQVDRNNYESEIVSNGATVQHDGNGKPKSSSNAVSGVVSDDNTFEGIKTVEAPGTSKPNNSVGEKITKNEKNEDIHAKLPAVHDYRDGEIRNKHDNKDDDIGETRQSYVGRDNVKAGDSGKDRKGDKEDDKYEKRERTADKNNVSKEKIKEQGGKIGGKAKESDFKRRPSDPDIKAGDSGKDRKGDKEDDKYEKRERTANKNNVSKELIKEQGGKIGGKAKESDFKRRPSDPDIKMDRKDKERYRRADDKDDNDRRREPEKNEREERSRDKPRSESSRHRRRRSRDESSDDTKRKLHPKKRILSPSPSPSRVRKRQYSRSPPSKRSHRRHSPFPSLETTRGRRSRSRSPAHRHR